MSRRKNLRKYANKAISKSKKRQDARQKKRGRRQSARQDRRSTRQAGRTARVTARQEGWTARQAARQEGKTERKRIKQDAKTARQAARQAARAARQNGESMDFETYDLEPGAMGGMTEMDFGFEEDTIPLMEQPWFWPVVIGGAFLLFQNQKKG